MAIRPHHHRRTQHHRLTSRDRRMSHPHPTSHPLGPHRRTAASRALGALVVVLLMLAGCTDPNGQSDGQDASAPHEAAAEALAAALSTGDMSAAPLAADQRTVAQADVDEALAQMEGIDREVEISWVSSPYEEDGVTAADAAMRWDWYVPGAEEPWSYPISVRLESSGADGEGEDAAEWHAEWSRDLIARELGSAGVFTVEYTNAERGTILDGDDEVLVANRPVYRIGIDKTFIDPDQWEDDAIALAEELEFDDPQAYADRVLAYGPRAFVDAVIIPQDNPEGLDTEALRSIEGVNFVRAERVQGPTEGFARPVLGRVGEATAEIIEASEGQVSAGDMVGLSGLQAQYEEIFRGTPGVTIFAEGGAGETQEESDGEGDAGDGDGAESDAAEGDDGATSATEDDGEAAADSDARQQVFSTEPVEGPALHTTLDPEVQIAAEEVLADVEPASALVAIRPSDGHILAVASGPGSQGWSTATLGQYAPGSTFKMVTALAMLRSGTGLEDTVQCPESLTVDGYTFSNNPGYPDDALGEITLMEAIAHSCNTAFVGQHETLDPAQIASAAAALGLIGLDEQGYPLFTGSVPQDVSTTEHAAAMIGQGQVLASPVGMAVVAASLSAGQTVTPTLLRDLEEFLEQAPGQAGGTDADAGEQEASDGEGAPGGSPGTDADAGGVDGGDGGQAGAPNGTSEVPGGQGGVPGDDGAGATPEDEGDTQGLEHEPLTNEEAAVLRQAMRAVVVDGTTPMLQDVSGSPVAAKSGTAEHGTEGTVRAWVIAIQDDLAVAAFVEDGEYGAATAGPLVQEFLDAVN